MICPKAKTNLKFSQNAFGFLDGIECWRWTKNKRRKLHTLNQNNYFWSCKMYISMYIKEMHKIINVHLKNYCKMWKKCNELITQEETLFTQIKLLRRFRQMKQVNKKFLGEWDRSSGKRIHEQKQKNHILHQIN